MLRFSVEIVMCSLYIPPLGFSPDKASIMHTYSLDPYTHCMEIRIWPCVSFTFPRAYAETHRGCGFSSLKSGAVCLPAGFLCASSQSFPAGYLKLHVLHSRFWVAHHPSPPNPQESESPEYFWVLAVFPWVKPNGKPHARSTYKEKLYTKFFSCSALPFLVPLREVSL